MTIEGDYTLFAHLETVYLGVLARRTLISTNTERVLRAANGKPIIFMPARHDHHRVQTGDGYAAYVAGAMSGAEIGVTSDAQASWWGGRGVGTVPHSLIAAYDGDTVLAATKFAEWAPADLHITVLVDFENDSVRHRPRRRRRARPAALGRAARHLGPARRPVALGGDGRLRPARRQRASRPQGARGARRCRARRRADRRLRRVLRREDRGVRAPRRPGRRVRRRLLPDPRRERLHRRHRRRRRQAELQGRPPPPSEPAARACPRSPILWDVDTQVDFVLPGGKLVVPGADGGGPCDGAARRVGAGGAASCTSRRPTTTS